MQRLLSRFFLGLALAAGMTSASIAQDIEVEIVNPDGDKVAPQTVGPIEIDDSLIKKGTTIISPNGTSQKLNLNGNQSITIRRSTSTVDRNGQRRSESSGKAIVIGPDGKRQEFDLDGSSDLGQLGLGGFLGQGTAVQAGKFMIGVYSDSVPPALAAQLDLETGSGLLVTEVTQDSPASKAGLQKHDVLLFADDKQLSTPADLVKAIQKSGEAKAAISLTLIQRGKETTIKVKPLERPENELKLGILPNDLGFQFRAFGPGAVINKGLERSLQQAAEKSRLRMQQIEEQMEKFDDRMKQFRERMKNMDRERGFE